MASGGRQREAGLRTAGAVKLLSAAMTADAVRLARLVPRQRIVSLVARTMLLAAVVSFLTLAIGLLWALHNAPMQGEGGNGPTLLIEAANGEPLGRVGPFRDKVPRQGIPEVLVQAVVSIEDRRFFSHWGVDPWAIARASYANWSSGGIVEGGSTITQQLAKLQIVGGERSLYRKLREAFAAIWLDYRLGKDEILTRYLNSVYLGAGAYGVSAAARTYFDKSLDELTLAEAALLAGLIQAPSRYDPFARPDAAQRRAAIVIDAMLETGAIGAKSARRAKAAATELQLTPKPARARSWFTDWIARHELPKVAESVGRPLHVRTTLQPALQQLAETIVGRALDRWGLARGVSQAALVAMRPDGSVVAMVGGRDYEKSQFNRAVDALRQPGSAFKLFVYYAALRNGYALDDTIDASPVRVGNWRPHDYGGREFGDMSLSEAFARSVNSAAVRLGMDVGLDEVVAAARELGLDAPLTKVPSMLLGTSEVSLIDLTGAYASVRAGHPKLEPWGIATVAAEGGALRWRGGPKASARELRGRRELIRLLEGAAEDGTARAAAYDGGFVAAKTGTSQDYRDAWFVGFNEDLVVGVWVGNDDRAPMKEVTGGSLPALIWKHFVIAAQALEGRCRDDDCDRD
jgi:1A family penicillin-binding protein